MLSFEPLLRARLETVHGLLGVWGLADMSAERTRPTPCAYVIYDGGRVLESQTGGAECRVATRWSVVLAVKNLSDALDGAPAREDAQALCNAVLQALLGWRADKNYQALHLADLPRAEYAAGILWLPLVFQTIQILKGDLIHGSY